ncbi:FadR/GntR family transcriptional regulator [Rothia sp. P7208]|uniref:FadR/GntR family transcriptional regulator n=1 Tax=Rothia sp. P7208 TaxID=3402660 RepID=UPI003AC66E6D
MKERTFSVLIDSIETKLRRGQLRVGDRLPGERALAEQYGISRASVREGLQVLGAVGLIRSQTGSGPKSGAIVVSEPSDALSWAIRMHIATKTLPVSDVVTTRILLEGHAARIAANGEETVKRSQALQRAKSYLDEMDFENISNERFHFCDTRFHYEISTLSENLALETVIDSLHLATVGYVEEAVPYLQDWENVKKELQKQHRKIYDSILAQDPDTAQQSVAEHITWFYALSDEAQKHREYHEKIRDGVTPTSS